MKNNQGFVLITVLIIVFALATLILTRYMFSTARTVDIASAKANLQLLYLAESGRGRVQAAADNDSYLFYDGKEFFLGNGSYELICSSGPLKTVTVNSYLPNKTKKEFEKTIVISGVSLTNNYTWQEL